MQRTNLSPFRKIDVCVTSICKVSTTERTLHEMMFIRRGDARSPTRDNKRKTTGLFGLNDRMRQRVEKYCQDTPPTRCFKTMQFGSP